MGERPVGREGRITKDREEALAGDGFVHCLPCGGAFMGPYICQFVETCKLVCLK